MDTVGLPDTNNNPLFLFGLISRYNFKSTQKRDENRWKGLPVQEPFGSSCTFVCDLLMVESVKCATKRTTKRSKDLVMKTHTRPEDSNDVRVTQPLSGNSSADKSDSILKISVDLWPVLTMAIEPKVDQTEICDELKNEEIVQTNEIKMAEQLKEARSTQKVHTLDTPLGRGHRPRSILPPLKTSDMQKSESLKSINPWFRPSVPPIVGFDKDPVDFAHSKSIIGKKYEEEQRPMKSDMINNILNQNVRTYLYLMYP